MKLSAIPVLLVIGTALSSQLQAQTTQAPTPEPERTVSLKTLIPNLGNDQKKIWLFPAKLTKRKYLLPSLAVVGVTAALIAADSKDAPWFRNSGSFGGFNQVFSGSATSWGTIAVPVALYAAGRIAGNSKLSRTALFAGEAVGDVEILTTVLKDVTKRERPIDVKPGQSYSDTWFNSPGSFLRGHGSFPSGHTIAAFSVATVVSRRYKNHKWIPFVAYGLAATVGFSRVTLSSHYVSDVFVGGALGYTISRFAVLHD